MTGAGLPWPALLLAALALLLWTSPRSRVSRRARELLEIREPPSSGSRRVLAPALPGTAGGRRWLLASGAGAATGTLVGGVPGAVLAVGVAVGAERLLRSGAADLRQAARAAHARQLPAACDLLAVCLAAGVPVTGALASVGEAVPAPLGPELRGIAALYRMGADARRAWADVPPELGALGRVLVRAGESGSAVGPALRAVAAEGRAAARAETEAAVRRAGVWVLAPLGLCFLPAFVCLGVAPLVLGIAGDVFG